MLHRSKQVIVLIGDGGFKMLMSEFLTAVHHKLPVKVVVYNIASLGLISVEAESIGIAVFHEAIEYPDPDYVTLAGACGGAGFTDRDGACLQSTLREAFATAARQGNMRFVPVKDVPASAQLGFMSFST